MDEFDNYCKEQELTGDDYIRFKEYCSNKLPETVHYTKAYPAIRDLWLCFLIEDSLRLIQEKLGQPNER